MTISRVEIAVPNMMVLGGTRERELGHKIKPSRMELAPLWEEMRQKILLFSLPTVCQAPLDSSHPIRGKRAFIKTDHTGPLKLDSQSPALWEINVSCLSHPGYCILLQQPKLRQAYSCHLPIFLLKSFILYCLLVTAFYMLNRVKLSSRY